MTNRESLPTVTIEVRWDIVRGFEVKTERSNVDIDDKREYFVLDELTDKEISNKVTARDLALGRNYDLGFNLAEYSASEDYNAITECFIVYADVSADAVFQRINLDEDTIIDRLKSIQGNEGCVFCDDCTIKINGETYSYVSFDGEDYYGSEHPDLLNDIYDAKEMSNKDDYMSFNSDRFDYAVDEGWTATEFSQEKLKAMAEDYDVPEDVVDELSIECDADDEDELITRIFNWRDEHPNININIKDELFHYNDDAPDF